MRTKKVKVIQVIQVDTIRGAGTEDDPVRSAKEYWDFEGNFLFALDSRAEERE